MLSAAMPSTQQTTYVLKIITVLLALCLLVACAAWLPLSGWTSLQKRTALAVLLLLSLGIIPLCGWLYRRADELQRLQHQQASMQTVAVLDSGCPVDGGRSALPLNLSRKVFG